MESYDLSCRSVIAFARSIEGGKILRPSDGYFWASNCENCTYNITSLDCYFQGLSSCSLDPIKSTATDLMNQDDRETKFGKRLAVANPDICTQAMAIKKPIAWVAGQYLSYIIRPRHDIQAEIYERIKGVLPNINRKHESFIAVHYRGGQPDFNRKVIPLDSYMKAVHQKAELLAMEGRPVSVVYLASQDNVHLFMNTSFLKENYGGNFTYKFLPPLTSNVDPSKEIELELRSHPDIPRKPYVVEFLADFQLMVKADVFIGSISTIYMIVMLLRYARHPGRRKDFTCLINTNSEIVCEDDPRKYDIYYNFNYLILGNGGGGEDRFGGLKGGTPF